jgi:hypothetical protein
MNLCGQDHIKSTQLVYDPETDEFQNYCQLGRDPKHKAIWSKSAANELGCLAQGVGEQVKGTDSIHFIGKGQRLQDRKKDVTL